MPSAQQSTLETYLGEIRRYSILSHEELIETARSARAGDARAFERLVTANLPFVVHVATQLRRFLPIEDLVNEGNLGLIEAARRYDPDMGVHFLTYADWWVRKAILKYESEHARLVRVPPYQREKQVRERREQRGSFDDVHTGRMLKQRHIPIEDVVGEEVSAVPLAAVSGDPYALLEADERSRMLYALLEGLEQPYRRILELRYGIEQERAYTLQEIADEKGVSREYIRKLEMRGKEKLRRLAGRYR